MSRKRIGLLLLLPVVLLVGAASLYSIPQPDAAEGVFEELYVAAGDLHIGALRAGDAQGLRVIYVHGSPGSAEAWADFLADPIAGTESVALDRPGYGRSDQGVAVGLAAQAAALEPLLVQRDGHWPILVGHSLGGPIIARAAVDFPGRVGGLMIVGGDLDPALEDLRWFNYLGKALAWFVPAELERSNQELWPLQGELEALAPLLASITCPVTIVHGREDGLVPFANVAYMQRHLSGASRVDLLDFEDGGHFVLWVEPYESALRESLGALVRVVAAGADPAPAHSSLGD